MANTKIPAELSSTPGIIDNSNATAITIDSSENTQFAGTAWLLDGKNIYLGTDGDMRLRHDNSNGYIDCVTGSLILRTGGGATEAMRIDSSGNLLVGKTSAAGQSSAGIEARGDGVLIATKAGIVQYLNRTGSDGAILNFAKDGSTVGSIGSRSGVVSYIALDPRSNGAGLTGNTNEILPTTETGALVSDTKSLGSSAWKFKDLYLSGTATVGANIILDANDSYVGFPSNGIYYNNSADHISVKTAGAEHMRIDSSGSVCIGTTAPIASSGSEELFIKGSCGSDGYISAIQHTGNANSNRDFIRFYNNSGTDIGAVEHTNPSSVTYSTSSDYRLKENVRPLEKGLERLLKLNPVKYDWKNTSETSEGFLAHEVQEAGWYEGVSGKKDDENMQGMEYGKLTPLLVKAIQEQQTQIDALQSEINELKNS